MDPGATVSLVTSRVVQDLRLPKIPHEIILTGLGGERRSCHYVEIRLSSIWNDADDDYLTVRCQVVDTLLPVGECSDAKKIKNMPLVQGKEPLADPTFGCSSRINLLLGVGDVARVYKDERVHFPDQSIQMELTVFGWMVSGQAQSSSGNEVVMRIAEKTTDSILEKLWEREEVP